MLRSIAYQTALQLPDFRRALVDLAKSGVKLTSADPLTVWGKLFSSILATSVTDESIYWVLDGLDEAESCKSVVAILSRVGNFASSIHILVFTRPLPGINMAFQRAKKNLHVTDMPLPDNRSDIRLMVAEEIDYLASSEDFKAEAVDQITARSQGSFLWATLVTKRVLKCHRKEQVKQVLHSTPDGMQDLYDRMADAILELEVGEDKALARILLTWAMYAKTPVTVAELSELYPTELGSIMDLDHTISQVCGQFVVVNPQGRVTLVHHSAREYLEKAKRRPFALSSEQANEVILGKCLEVLCDKGLRRKLRTFKPPKSLTYASTAWASHLEGSARDSDRALDALIRFFSGPYPLAWIQYLAMSGGLAEVIGASRRLAAYASMRERANADICSTLHRTADLSLLQAWAVDLLKLPAKFGRRLSQLPAAIYECIPMLCPASSIIHQMFKDNPAATLSVSGMPNVEWDDCLARVSSGLGRAQRLAVSPLYLAVTNDEPRGTITVWDTELLTRRKTFSLGEHVWQIAFSTSGSLLACYSLSKTYVWSVSDWSLAICTDNPHQERAIEFKFDKHDALMVISEHNRVYKLRVPPAEASPWEPQDASLLDEPRVPEGRLYGTPSCVAFSSDCTRIAVAYPRSLLSIWTVDPPQMIARLETKSNSHTGTNRVAWHPSGAEVICIYGQVFKWSFGDDTYQEVKDQAGGDPHGLACSPDGRVFAIIDTKGSVKIYDMTSMSLVYTLTSNDHSSRICFSSDNLRFYDLRGSYCNVWEPHCLLRLADAAASEEARDAEDTAGSFWSDTDNIPSGPILFPASESHAESRPAIVALDPGQASMGLLVAHANYEGSISVHDSDVGKKYEVGKVMFRMQVEHLAWDPGCNRLAYSLANGATTVKAIAVDSTGGGDRALSAESVYADKRSHTDRGRTRQLLFDCTTSRLLISGFKKCQILSLPDGAIMAERQVADEDEAVQWKQHPSEPEQLLCFSTRTIAICTWNDLTQRSFIPLTVPVISNADDNTTIDAILDNHSPHYLLLRTTTMAHFRPRYKFAVLPTQDIYTCAPQSDTETGPDTKTTTVQALPIPTHLSGAISINHALGILPDNRLVFVDRQFWVCTTQLPPPAPPVPPTSTQKHSHSGTVAAAAAAAGPGGGRAAVGVADPSPAVGKAEVQRHFFLPQEWVTSQGLRLCRVLRDGTVLCPARGEVAVLRARGLVS
jgi:WD40 repeat protein